MVWRIHGRHLVQLAELKKRVLLLPDGPLYFARKSCWIIDRNRPGTWKRAEACGWEVWILTGRQRNCRSLYTSWPGATNQKYTKSHPKGSSSEWRSQEGGKLPWIMWQFKHSIHPVFIFPPCQWWAALCSAQCLVTHPHVLVGTLDTSLDTSYWVGSDLEFAAEVWIQSLTMTPGLPVNTREERKFEMEARFLPNGKCSESFTVCMA